MADRMQWALGALIIITVNASAGVYRCKTADGQTTFSDRPCGDSAEALSIDASAPAGGGSSGGLRPGELEMLERAKERDATARLRSQEQSARNPSYGDSRRIKELQRAKDRISSELERRDLTRAQRMAMIEEMKSLDREMAALKGAPVVFEKPASSFDNQGAIAHPPARGPIPSTSGGFFNPAAGGYISPKGQFCPEVAGGLACPGGFVPITR